MKWSSNIEISIEILKDLDITKSSFNFLILFKPNSRVYKRIFGVYYCFNYYSGIFGVLKEGEDLFSFNDNTLGKKVHPGGNNDKSLWQTDKLKVSSIIKDNKFEIRINDEAILSAPLGEISKEKGFPNTPIQIIFTKTSNNDVQVKMDNLYIGPPRNLKK